MDKLIEQIENWGIELQFKSTDVITLSTDKEGLYIEIDLFYDNSFRIWLKFRFTPNTGYISEMTEVEGPLTIENIKSTFNELYLRVQRNLLVTASNINTILSKVNE